MGLEVDVPDAPSLSGAQDPGEYDAVDRPDDWDDNEVARAGLADMLAAGAWEDAFEEWRTTTSMTAEQFRAVLDLDLIDRFDFYVNPAAEDVGYRAPELLDDRPAPYDEALDRHDVEEIEEELDDLGRTVSEVLENDYIHRGSEAFGYDWE